MRDLNPRTAGGNKPGKLFDAWAFHAPFDFDARPAAICSSPARSSCRSAPPPPRRPTSRSTPATKSSG